MRPEIGQDSDDWENTHRQSSTLYLLSVGIERMLFSFSNPYFLKPLLKVLVIIDMYVRIFQNYPTT